MFYDLFEHTEEYKEIASEKGIELYYQQHKKEKFTDEVKITKKKISFVAQLCQMHNLLQEESENILIIKNYNENILPKGLLLRGKSALDAFLEIKKQDSIYEKRPKSVKRLKIVKRN